MSEVSDGGLLQVAETTGRSSNEAHFNAVVGGDSNGVVEPEEEVIRFDRCDTRLNFDGVDQSGFFVAIDPDGKSGLNGSRREGGGINALDGIEADGEIGGLVLGVGEVSACTRSQRWGDFNEVDGCWSNIHSVEGEPEGVLVGNVVELLGEGQ